MGKSDLAGIRCTRKHAFAREHAAQRHTIETTDQLSFPPAFHRMGETSLMGRMTPEERQQMETRLLGVESFSIGGTRTPIEPYPLRGLFDGLSGFEGLDS